MKENLNLSIGYSFPPIPRAIQRSARCRNNVNFDNVKDMKSIFNCIHNYITDDIKNIFYNIRILLKNARKKYLKEAASEIMLNETSVMTDLMTFQYFLFILDTIDTKLYKHEQIKQKKNCLNILTQQNVTIKH